MGDLPLRACIKGTGSFLPEIVMTNKDVEALCPTTNDEWIRKRTGIEQRHRSKDGEGSSVLAIEAAKLAMADAGVTAEEIECIICPTVTPDQISPCVSQLTQAGLGAVNASAFDINAACSGFVYGLQAADAFVRAGVYKTLLIIGAETTMRLLNWEYRDTAVLFADGAGAVVVVAEEYDGGVLMTNVGADGTGEELLSMPQGGFRHERTPENLEDEEWKILMKGPELYKRAVHIFESEIRNALKQGNVGVDDIDLFIPHQANARIIETVRERVGLPTEKCFVNIDHTGNTVAASIPIALDEANKAGLIKKGDLVLFAAFGAGLTWGSALIRW